MFCGAHIRYVNVNTLYDGDYLSMFYHLMMAYTISFGMCVVYPIRMNDSIDFIEFWIYIKLDWIDGWFVCGWFNVCWHPICGLGVVCMTSDDKWWNPTWCHYMAGIMNVEVIE